ncbi:molybdopterin-guanine dinucleotide biosynthesis protein B [Paenibacillus psychroresistens]|uniref:Molybdopterin-guanine dinucleotide biosynthesis protein B n=1 Tax=Paenibacillus psychroresistens TaxID=1778678 RepID=A0A6B8RFJ2_9BACL|nr:molybdopterin-guanine dinucleotide biosynthesis protein B [Paenibacillus psychroresistens]QGQ94494.1 molybdopterin-guanine dinucleotide biosynthesis protein B [Paenibacillus psychroresistens]
MTDSNVIRTTPPHLGFVGFSGSGKTTLVSQIVMQLKRKEYRVGVLKHDAHDFQMDVEGKDTFKYSEAGADLITISSAAKLNILEKHPKPLELKEILQRMSGVDLILIEGYKQADVPKILVARTLEQLALYSQLNRVVAIASTFSKDDPELTNLLNQPSLISVLDLNDVSLIAAYVEDWLLNQLK